MNNLAFSKKVYYMSLDLLNYFYRLCFLIPLGHHFRDFFQTI